MQFIISLTFIFSLKKTQSPIAVEAAIVIDEYIDKVALTIWYRKYSTVNVVYEGFSGSRVRIGSNEKIINNPIREKLPFFGVEI